MKSDNKKLTADKCKDAGLALVLISLICYQVWQIPLLMMAAIVCLIIAMTYPPIFKPFAICWFALSAALGTVVSKILLTGLFFTLVLPVGMIRRLMGKDSMRLKCWKKGSESVFRVRDHRFAAKDLELPY
jgi:hypothetical protein